MHPPRVDRWDAIVLAGGRGSRLGGIDKAALEIDGETLLARTLRAVAGADRVVVVGDVVVGDAELDDVIVVQESPRFSGPASAVGAAIEQVRSPYVLLAGCDQPFLAEAIDALLAAVDGDGAVAVDAAGRRQHLMSVIHAAALRSSMAAQTTLVNLSVHALLGPLDLVEVPVSPRAALDIDTWHDREKALEEGARDG